MQTAAPMINTWGPVAVIVIGYLLGIYFQNKRIDDLRNDMNRGFDDINRRFEDLRNEMNARFADLKDYIKSEISRLEDRIRQ